ncbi:unnamed protein product [Microthlaspi erraticum]|uniref:F-box domain-containing protein n=1 Tax=Microthlaspi erraticum TaxID=1685480 RepID=A0A6D2KXG4_9BRAS|nr:unnamed protein product [Microthlaspi erraticum]
MDDKSDVWDEWYEIYSRARPREEAMISKLPDALISQILSYLPTKEAVRTSVLSNRWKSLWLLIPALDLASSRFPDYNAFVSFVDRLLGFCREEKSCLHKLKLSIQKDVNDPPCLTRWIDFVVRRKLEHLDVECLVNRKFLEVMPLSLYVCDTLVSLRLHRVSLSEFESVSLPRVKTMSLEHNIYANDASLESLISSCPVLEDLNLVRMVTDNVKVVRVHSQTLTSLDIDYSVGEGDDYADGYVREGSAVLVDAPRLKCLKWQDDLSDSKVLTNTGSLVKVDFDFVFNLENDFADVADLWKRNMVRNFFTSISRVRDMTISAFTAEFLYFNMEYDPLPQFCNLSRLQVNFYLYNLDMLPTLLESCPNLKSLVMDFDFDSPSSKENELMRLSSVPRCLLSSLEFVEIKRFNGGAAKMEVARYFVENSVVLRKLVLHLRCSMLQEGFNMLKDLIALPRRSSTCRIEVC